MVSNSSRGLSNKGATISCYAVIAIFATIISEANWRTDALKRSVDQLQLEFPFVEYFVWKVESSWVPFPWETDEQSTISLMKRLVQTSFNTEKRISKQFLSVGNPAEKFERYLEYWGAYSSLCQYINTVWMDVLPQVCSSSRRHALPGEWREIFFASLADRYYFDYEGMFPKLAYRLVREDVVCNLTPLSQSVRQINHVASEKAVLSYRQYLGEEIHEFGLKNAFIIKPGECLEFRTAGYDIPAIAYFNSSFTDNARAVWFADNWVRYHAPEFRDASFRARANEAVRQRNSNRHQLSTCPGVDHLKAGLSSSEVSCSDGHGNIYMSGHNMSDGRNYTFLYIPKLVDERRLVSDDGSSVRFDRLRDAQSIALKLSQHVATQFRLEMKWKDRVPAFSLTPNDNKNIVDTNGPFVPGVGARSIPTETPMGTLIDIPSSGTVIEFGSCLTQSLECSDMGYKTSIWSQYDLMEALDSHGRDQSRGILKPILIGFSGHNYFYPTQYLFNTGANLRGVAVYMDDWACLSTDGSWVGDQSRALAQQLNPSGYKLCQFGKEVVVSVFLGVGASKFARVIMRGLGAGRATAAMGRMLMVGGVESVLGAGFVSSSAPVLQPTDVTESQMVLAAKIGFAAGAFFELLL